MTNIKRLTIQTGSPDPAMAAWEEISDAEIESAVRRVTGDHTGEYTQNDRDFYGELTRELVKRIQPASGEDGRRLDWLESQINERGAIHLHDGSKPYGHGLGLRPGNMKRSLRDAIDKAMRQGGQS